MMRCALEALAVFGAAVALLVAGAIGDARAQTCGVTSTQPSSWDATARSSSTQPTLTNNNMTAQETGADFTWAQVRGTLGQSSGKWYFEVNVSSGTVPVQFEVGVVTAAAPVSINSYFGGSAFAWVLNVETNGHSTQNNNANTYFDTTSSTTAGEVDGVAVDLDNHKIWFSHNGVWYGGGNPATGVNPAMTVAASTLYPAYSMFRLAQFATVNFGATPFAYTPPSGFNGWATTAATCTGQFVCTAPNVDASACTAWTDIFDSSKVATFDQVGVTGQAVGLAFAFGCGMVLAFVGFGLGIGSVSRVIKEVLGDRYT